MMDDLLQYYLQCMIDKATLGDTIIDTYGCANDIRKYFEIGQDWPLTNGSLGDI